MSLARSAVEDAFGQKAMSGVIGNKVNPIDYWTRKGIWLGEYFELDDQTRKDFEKDSWLEKYRVGLIRLLGRNRRNLPKVASAGASLIVEM
jgi:hypothetical protein